MKMIKDILRVITENKDLHEYHFMINKYLENLENDQIMFQLNNGMPINFNKTIYLYFIPNNGFRCTNTNSNKVGNLPVCNLIERKLNKKLDELVKK